MGMSWCLALQRRTQHSMYSMLPTDLRIGHVHSMHEHRVGDQKCPKRTHNLGHQVHKLLILVEDARNLLRSKDEEDGRANAQSHTYLQACSSDTCSNICRKMRSTRKCPSAAITTSCANKMITSTTHTCTVYTTAGLCARKEAYLSWHRCVPAYNHPLLMPGSPCRHTCKRRHTNACSNVSPSGGGFCMMHASIWLLIRHMCRLCYVCGKRGNCGPSTATEGGGLGDAAHDRLDEHEQQQRCLVGRGCRIRVRGDAPCHDHHNLQHDTLQLQISCIAQRALSKLS